MSTSCNTKIHLVKKNNSWVPQKKIAPNILEAHGIIKGPKLGEGAYAKVYLGESRKHNNRKVAIKVIDKFKAPKDFLSKFLDREVSIMKRLQHPNVIQLYHAIETDTKVYLLLELAEKGDLLEYVNGRDSIPEHEARRLFCQLAAAMAYCHNLNVIHRDIKCENILIDAYGNLKVTDFGFAAYTDKNRLLETFCGSYAYCCPEILRGEPYCGMMGDVWSMGVVLYALVCSRLPFSDDDLRVIVKGQNVKQKIKFAKTVSKGCRDLIKRMLALDRKKRYTASKVLQHPWIKDEFSTLKANYKNITASKSITAANFNLTTSPVSRDYEEERYPMAVESIHPKIGNSKRKLSRCLTVVDTNKSPVLEQGKKRRHTVATEFDLSLIPNRKGSLRDELLRSLADKEMRSRSAEMLIVRDVKKSSLHEMDIPHPAKDKRRRSSLVTDIKKVDTALSNSRKAATRMKSSLVSDVIKVDARSGTQQKQVTSPKKLQHLENKPGETTMDSPAAVDRVSSIALAQLKSDQEKRQKELDQLKFSTAGKAARALAEEKAEAAKKNAMAEEAILQLKLQEVAVIEKMDKWRGKCEKMMGVKKPLLPNIKNPLELTSTPVQRSISHFY